MAKKIKELLIKPKFLEREKITPIKEAAKNIFVTKKMQTKIILDSFWEIKSEAISDTNPETETKNKKNEDALPRFFAKTKVISNKTTITEKKTIEITLPVLSSNPLNNKF
ncbi:MAG: hypothetical protein ABI840_08945 [bacterium]